jgi:hypothetical protein
MYQLTVNSHQLTIRSPLYLLLNTYYFEKVTKVTLLHTFYLLLLLSVASPFYL